MRFSPRQALGNDHGKCNPGWTGGGGTAGKQPHVLFICLKSQPSHCVPVHGSPPGEGASPARPAHGTGMGKGFFPIWNISIVKPGSASVPEHDVPCAAFPAASLAPWPRAHPLHGVAFRIKDVFPSTKLVFQRKVVFLLEKDPTGPTQIVILGHVLYRISIFLSLDALLSLGFIPEALPKGKAPLLN